MIYAFSHLPTNAKILEHIRDYVRRFCGNCQTLFFVSITKTDSTLHTALNTCKQLNNSQMNNRIVNVKTNNQSCFYKYITISLQKFLNHKYVLIRFFKQYELYEHKR